MRHRLLASVTAGALVLSSLVLGTYAAQADGPSGTVVVEADEGTAVGADAVTPDADATDGPSMEPVDDPAMESADDPSNEPDIIPIPADATLPSDDQSDVTATITGKVTAPGSTNALMVYVAACEVSDVAGGPTYTGNCTSTSVGGTSLTTSGYPYSISVTPGAEVVVYASANGYVTTFVGGYTTTGNVQSMMIGDSITRITTDPNGGTVENQNIELVKAGSISGSVILPDGYTFADSSLPVGSVSAYLVSRSDGTPRIGGQAVVGWFGGFYGGVSGSTAAYTINGLIPGSEYLVMVDPSSIGIDQNNDLVATAAGGYASTASVYNWDARRSDMGLVTAVAGDVTNISIIMVKGDVVSGTITPTDAPNKTAQVCEITGTGSRQSTNCKAVAVDATTGYYSSAGLTPGATVMVQAKADGYLYTWLGGYASTSGEVGLQDGKTQVTAPASGQDIALQQVAVISGTLSVPGGYSAGSRNVYAAEVVQTEDGPSLGGTISASTSSDGTYRIEAKPGSTYVVYAPSGSGGSPVSAPDYNTDLLSAVAGGYLTSSATSPATDISTHLSDPSIDKITMTEDKTVNLTMPLGAKITGTVYLPDGTPIDPNSDDPNVLVLVDVACIPVSSYNDGTASWNSIARGTINDDGSYSCTVIPGRDYVVLADTDSFPYTSLYPTTWVGGFVGSDPTLPDAKVTQITARGAGQTTPGQDIHLSAGSSISGRLIGYVPNPDPGLLVQVFACALYPNGSIDDCAYTTTIADDGSYTVTGVVPGVDTVAYTEGNGYTRSWHGGYVGSSPSFSNPKVTEFTSAALGWNVPNIDITLVKPVTITGSIIPSTVVSDSAYNYMAILVYGCPVSTQDGQSYYRTADGVRGMGGIYSGNDHSAFDDERWCTWNGTTNSDGSYSLQVLPGVDYVIVAQAEGYTDAWHGGYVGDSGIVDVAVSPDRVLPVTSKIQIVSGTAGQTLTGKDIVFGESQTWTVTFVDGQGTTLVTRTVIDGGSAEAPADPTRSGYTFTGWDVSYTDVTSDVTVTAQWVPAPTVTPPAQAVTVTFDTQGGTAISPVTVAKGGSVTLPTLARTEESLFMGWFTQPGGAGTQVSSPMTVTADTTVYASWIDAPAAEVVKEVAVVESTGGLARAASGTDPYKLVTTLTSDTGDPMLGLAGHLTAVAPANVTASGFTDNHDGTYSVEVCASVPGNYLITVLLDGVEVPGSPIPVNFIGADIAEPVRMVGDTQSAEGLGFLPGEQVDVTVHSDPINVGRRTADAEGRVPVSFDVPKGFDLGRHTVEFVGVTSGTATVSFSVATPTADSSQIQGQTGGTATSQTNGSLFVLAGVLVVAGLLVQRLRPRTAKRG